jgi:hypothetical protein
MSFFYLSRRLLLVFPLLLALGGCGTTVYLDKVRGTVGQKPNPPATGSSQVSDTNAVIARDPRSFFSSDRWLRLSRTVATDGGGQYTANFTQNVTNGKVGVDLVGFIPSSAPVMMTVHFESGAPQAGIPVMHIDLLPDGKIRIDDSTIAGSFKFNSLVGFFITFNLTGAAPTAEILIRGGDKDASLTVALPANAATRGLGRVRILAPFEGVNAPNGHFFVNDVVAIRPN